MISRGSVTVLVASALITVLIQGVASWPAYATAVTVEFQDGGGNTRQSFSPGEDATFYVYGADLGTLASSTATWTLISTTRVPTTTWSLASGSPEKSVFALTGSSSDTSTPASTPLYSAPAPFVNDGTVLLNDCDALTGEFTLVNDVDAASTLRVDFTYYLVSAYPAADHRASVTSTSDADGEWVALSAVVSQGAAGLCPIQGEGFYPPPGLFSGQVLLRDDAGATAAGDGAVRARPGDILTVTFYDSDGLTVLGTHQADVTATATPVPAVGWLPLGLLAGVIACWFAWRLRRAAVQGGHNV